jgi:hypothetical protein
MTSGGGRLHATTAKKQGQPQSHETQSGLSILRQPQLIVVGDRQQTSQVHASRITAAFAQLCHLGVGE